MQGLIGPPPTFHLFTSSEEGQAKIPFVYFSYHFTSGFSATTVKVVREVYEGLIQQTRSSLGISGTEVTPHNVVMWKDWIIVIP